MAKPEIIVQNNHQAPATARAPSTKVPFINDCPPVKSRTDFTEEEKQKRNQERRARRESERQDRIARGDSVDFRALKKEGAENAQR